MQIRAQLPSLTALEKKVIADNRHPEFVLGRDHYISAQNLAIGFTIKNGPETVLSSAALKVRISSSSTLTGRLALATYLRLGICPDGLGKYTTSFITS